ncbi:unnamed protein product [Lepidochelys kempii]
MRKSQQITKRRCYQNLKDGWQRKVMAAKSSYWEKKGPPQKEVKSREMKSPDILKKAMSRGGIFFELQLELKRKNKLQLIQEEERRKLQRKLKETGLQEKTETDQARE